MNTLSKCALGALLAAGFSYNTNADFSLTLNNEFSGGAQPTGSVILTFQDVATNTVNLTIAGAPLSGTEFASDVYFNLNPIFSPANLGISESSRSGTFTLGGITQSANSLQADGGGRYDIQVSFLTSPPRFDLGDSITLQIMGAGPIANLVAADFNFPSSPPAGNGTQTAAAHIQGIAPNSSGATSGFVGPGTSVPDGAATAMLLGIALASLGAFRRRLA
jgi:hypothetical protein